MAVYYTGKSAGRNTPGVDQITYKMLETSQGKLTLVDKLRHLESYQSSPIRRVFIPKGKGKLRPLGIPTVWDRCVQYLIKLILEPVIEPFSDTASFGYRENRSAHNALGLIRSSLESRESLYDRTILKVDIQSFFDEISHE